MTAWRATLLLVATFACGRAETDAPVQSPRGGSGSVAQAPGAVEPDAYPSDRGKDLGVTTWPPDQWRLGGGTVWGWIPYDPQLDLVYYGTGNPGVWNPALGGQQ